MADCLTLVNKVGAGPFVGITVTAALVRTKTAITGTPAMMRSGRSGE
jgi:hypothetical protein